MAKNYILESTEFVSAQGETTTYDAASIIPISIFENNLGMVHVEINGSAFYGKIFYFDGTYHCYVMDVDNSFPDNPYNEREAQGQHFIADIELWEPSEYEIQEGEPNCSVEVNFSGQHVGLGTLIVSIYTESAEPSVELTPITREEMFLDRIAKKAR